MKPVIMLFVSFMLFILGATYTAEASNGYEAIITKEKATFIFPVKPRKFDEWYDGDFIWTVSFKNKKKVYEVGYITIPARGTNAPHKNNNLRSALLEGQIGIFSNNSFREGTVTVTTNNQENKVILVVTGKDVTDIFYPKVGKIKFDKVYLGKRTIQSVVPTYH